MEAPSETKDLPNPSTVTTQKKSKKKEKINDFEFCKVCKLNHNQGRRHNYFPNHVKSLSSFLSRFQSKLSDVRFFLKNPSLLRPELASHHRFWCVFCDFDVTEHDSDFACLYNDIEDIQTHVCCFASEKAISHLASTDHFKNLKGFLWKYGGGMDRVDRFRVSEADLAKYEKKCISMKSEDGSEQSRGPLIGPSNDIHNETKFDYVDSSCFPNSVLPLQNHTNESYQVSHSDLSGHAATHTFSYDNQSLLLASDAQFSKNLTGNAGWNSITEGSPIIGSSAGLQKLTPISSTSHEPSAGNVHSGAPPPWFNATDGTHLDTVKTKTVKSKLNPKRVGAAWAEKRKIEMEMEKRGALPVNRFDASWLPNFGRVWQSGSRKDSRKEFELEAQKPVKEESQTVDSSLQLQPYVSKRMRREANGS